jgi:hypothetical protein
MVFRLDHHKAIATILEELEREIFEESNAYFGGGTVLALDFDEYRWSKDIDFLCSIQSEGYRNLRSFVFDHGCQGLFRRLDRITLGRQTTDQYGIRMTVLVEEQPIKFEIIAEARFTLDPPRYPTRFPVPCLSLGDCFTSKLLANADRFMDDSVESRDLIDLAMLRYHSGIPASALEKAETAYDVIRPLQKALQRFQDHPSYREKCFVGLQIDPSNHPKIIDGLDLLAADFQLPITERTFWEEHRPF